MAKSGRRKKDAGATMVEYALLAALIAVMGIASVSSMTDAAKKPFQSAGDAMQCVGNGHGQDNCGTPKDDGGF
jgi:Flp pilus assembly pilin Flp